MQGPNHAKLDEREAQVDEDPPSNGHGETVRLHHKLAEARQGRELVGNESRSTGDGAI